MEPKWNQKWNNDGTKMEQKYGTKIAQKWNKNSTEDIKMSKITLSTQIIEKVSNDELKKYAQAKNDTSAK